MLFNVLGHLEITDAFNPIHRKNSETFGRQAVKIELLKLF